MALTMAGSLRSASTLLALTAVMSRVAGLIVTSTSVRTRPKALALVTGTNRPVLLGRPVGRGVTTPVLLTSCVLAEQL